MQTLTQEFSHMKIVQRKKTKNLKINSLFIDCVDDGKPFENKLDC